MKTIRYGTYRGWTLAGDKLIIDNVALDVAELIEGIDGDPSWQRLGESVEDFNTKLAGVTFKNSDGSSRQAALRSCVVGEVLELRREPKNPYDPNAVAVVRGTGDQIGYLSRFRAWQVALQMEAGRRYTAVITQINRGPFRWFRPRLVGANIRVTAKG